MISRLEAIIITCKIICAFDGGVTWDHHNPNKKKKRWNEKKRKNYHIYLNSLEKKQQLNYQVYCAFNPKHRWQCEILLLFSKTWDISSPPTDQSSHQRNKKFCGLFTSSSDSSPSAFLTETWWNLMGTFGNGFPLLLKTYFDKVS